MLICPGFTLIMFADGNKKNSIGKHMVSGQNAKIANDSAINGYKNTLWIARRHRRIPIIGIIMRNEFLSVKAILISKNTPYTMRWLHSTLAQSHNPGHIQAFSSPC